MFHFQDWLNYFVRWIHVIAAISWIGSSFYFMWLDSHLTLPEAPKQDVEGELWMVHSGGFYLVERKLIGPGTMPKTLHWFKFEALFTWLSGAALLTIIYYTTGGTYLVDPAVAKISAATATAISIGTLILAWAVYDLIWVSALGRKFPRFSTGLCLALAGAAAYGFCHVLSGRAAFIHIGAMFGTIMVANVWMRILPAQQKMIDATKEGRKPDFTLSGYAKRRSVHNSYMTFPVIFMMLSNHYPMAYAGRWNWVVLLLLIVLGAAIRHLMLAKNGSGKWALVPAAAALAALVALTTTPVEPVVATAGAAERVSFAQARDVIQRRCVYCHSTHPVEPTFGPTPGGVNFEIAERIHALAPRIKYRAVETKTMPLGNKTGITDAERALLGRWVDEGAPMN